MYRSIHRAHIVCAAPRERKQSGGRPPAQQAAARNGFKIVFGKSRIVRAANVRSVGLNFNCREALWLGKMPILILRNALSVGTSEPLPVVLSWLVRWSTPIAPGVINGLKHWRVNPVHKNKRRRCEKPISDLWPAEGGANFYQVQLVFWRPRFRQHSACHFQLQHPDYCYLTGGAHDDAAAY